jgi:hypothetical protein
VFKAGYLCILGVVTALALFMAGCGDSDETTTALTKAQFVKQGNALCKKREDERNKEIEAVFSKLQPGDELSDPRQAKLIQKLIIPSYEKMIADVKGLGAPEGDEAEVDEIVAAMEKTRDELEADPEEAVFTTVMFNPPNKLVRSYGLRSCAF